MSDQNGTFSMSEHARKIDEARQKREASNRSFELAGEQFTHRAGIAMEDVAEYLDMANGLRSVTNQDAIGIIDRTILAFLEPGQEEKWNKVRSNEQPHPITHTDAHALLEGLVQALSAYPTSLPSDSTDGDNSSTTTSTETSVSQEPVS